MPDTLRGWVKQARIDADETAGTTTSDAAKIEALEAENRELKRANEILLAGSSLFAREFDTATAVVVAFIDDHSDRFGVAPICRVLSGHGVPIAPSTYYAFKSRPASTRSVRDAELVVEHERVFFDRSKGRGISGARMVWRLLRREGIEVGRGRVERLMWAQGAAASSP